MNKLHIYLYLVMFFFVALIFVSGAEADEVVIVPEQQVIKSESPSKTYQAVNNRDPFADISTLNKKPLVSVNSGKTIKKPKVEKELLPEPPVDLRFIAIKYAEAESLVQLLSQNMLSERGTIGFDERTNILIVKDQKEYLEQISQIIDVLDSPGKQVQIEARIVIINEGNLQELGVRWGMRSDNISGSIEGINNDLLSDDAAIDIADYLNVNLASSSVNASSIAFQIGTFGSSALLDLELSALQAESKAEVISSPKLLTINKKPAYIEQGTEIPYLESSESGAATVKFRKAVLSLEATPQIMPDNKIMLDLLVTQDRPGQIVQTGTGEAIAIDTQRIDTQVIVDDGETIVLGGIFEHSMISSVDKVPLLADIPVLGNLFKRTYENETKRELLIFVTPQIIVE